MKLDTLLSDWQSAKSKLDHYKRLEKELRLKVIDEVFPLASAGSHLMKYNNVNIKASFGLSYSIDRQALAENSDLLTYEEHQCIRYDPKVNVAAFKAINSPMLNDIVTVKPALPTLKIEEEE